MDGLTVSQLARRAGVPATTLRFYEQQGLLPGRRSAAGYRLFDDDAVGQLRFIATAKALGLALEEIRTLLAPWRHDGCRDVQRALTPMLERRSAQARDRMVSLQAFAQRLDDARALLATIDRDGPCDASCAFLDRPRPAPPAACSLPAPSWEGRRQRWARVLTHATTATRSADGVRIELAPGVLDDDLGELVALVRAEHDCCTSLAMTLHVGADVVVEARTPDPGAADVVDALFGPLLGGVDRRR